MASSAAILLAAGASRRFRGANKLLMARRQRPLLWQALDAMAGSAARPLIVVSGHQRRQVRACVRLWQQQSRRPKPFCWVHNPRHRRGMGTSLAVGLAATPESCPGALVLLADLPGLRAKALNQVLSCVVPGLAAVAPVRGTAPAHPVWLARQLFTSAQALHADVGARAVLRGRADVLRPPLSAVCALDIDRRRDWKRLLRSPRLAG